MQDLDPAPHQSNANLRPLVCRDPPRHLFEPLHLLNFNYDAVLGPDPAFYSNADPDTYSKNNMDPDPHSATLLNTTSTRFYISYRTELQKTKNKVTLPMKKVVI